MIKILDIGSWDDDQTIAAIIEDEELIQKYDLRKQYTVLQFYTTEHIPEDPTDPTEPFMNFIEKDYVDNPKYYVNEYGDSCQYFKVHCFFFEPSDEDNTFILDFISSSYYMWDDDEGYIQIIDTSDIPEY